MQQLDVRGLPESRFRLATLKIGLVGLGKIAVDQHIPAIRNNPQLELVAGCSPRSSVEGLDVYRSLDEMLQAHPEIEAVAICTPPQVRQAIAEEAIAAGRHVFLEKPPAATLGEGEALHALASAHGVTVLAGWHSRFAPGVEPAREWMAARSIAAIRIEWRENVRQWHPGQRWIFEPGGMGVFDPGINSLSILTRLLGGGVVVQGAELRVPSNCNEPIQAELRMQGGAGVPIEACFDFLQEGEQTWSIHVAAVNGETMALHMGGKVMEVDGKLVLDEPEREYPRMYEHFARLIAARQSDLDMSPLRAVADARLVGKHVTVEPFVE
ncbi:Gfo/Idh/MocA family protein [Pseudoduganella guangdongensis]|nr:Gfo/Idh/MocA family oxidoreductase [Pseudoduganella guangdongensis]